MITVPYSPSTEVQAFHLSRMIYRDTKLEDYHRSGALLGMEVYDDMVKVVDENVKKVQRYHRIMTGVQTEKDARAQLTLMSPSERNGFMQYLSAFSYLSKCHCDWDPPRKIELLSPPGDLSAFILGGHFIECCQKHQVLSDSTMRYINQDIYNRIYTLLCENILP